jgi:hypothetical protein
MRHETRPREWRPLPQNHRQQANDRKKEPLARAGCKDILFESAMGTRRNPELLRAMRGVNSCGDSEHNGVCLDYGLHGGKQSFGLIPEADAQRRIERRAA